jgi:hypothetical protein
MRFHMRFRSLAVASALVVGASAASAQPVEAYYTLTGSANAWTYDFSFHNNITGANNFGLYYLGVSLGGPGSQSSPSGWMNAGWIDQSGPTLFDYVWFINGPTSLAQGQSAGGFRVTLNSASAPTEVRWFAHAMGSTLADYTGHGNVGQWAFNPRFEGLSLGAQPPVYFDEHIPNDGPGGGELYNEPFDEPEYQPLVVQDAPVTTTPEPSTWALMATGLAVLGYRARRRARVAASR